MGRYLDYSDMRLTLAGFILLCCCAVASAQPAEGEVESIGFDGYYRPNTVLPMKLRLRPKIGTAATYKLMILQEDMDGDRVLYSRPFTLNGNPEGGRIEEKVWVYFLPQARLLREARSATEMTNIIRVFLCNEKTGEQLVQIPVPPGTPLPKDLDAPAVFGSARGTRLILTVGDLQSKPFRDIYANARGIMEEVIFLPMTLMELPDSSLGFQAADAIVWLNADPGQLTTETTTAIQDYVRDGGRLVVCQNPNTWQNMQESDLAELLPVKLEGLEDERGLASLRRLAGLAAPTTRPAAGVVDPWADTRDRVFPIVKASAKSGAFVSHYRVGSATSPYLCRWMVGQGMVTWAAQDFGDPSILSTTNLRRTGWATIWDKTFDWRNRTITADMSGQSQYKADYAGTYKPTGVQTDLSRGFLGGMEASSKAAALVALAVLFFIGYWLLAGPGTYFGLLAKKRAHLSWFAYAAVAIGATALTMLLVRLVLRGPPELHHVTFVRVPANGSEPAMAQSQFGLYIKRDGQQEITLKDVEAKRASYLIPYPAHPEHVRDTDAFTSYFEYEVPIRDRNAEEATTIQVPYRSTLKKLQSRWFGKLPGAIEAKVKLEDGKLTGRLLNNTGQDLHAVFLIYTSGPGGDDWMMHVPDNAETGTPAWEAGKVWDLALLRSKMRLVGVRMDPEEEKKTVGMHSALNTGWMPWLGEQYFKGSLGETGSINPDYAAVLLSIYDRLAPSQGKKEEGSFNDRFELLRRAGRQLDASAAVSCGHLLVVARSDPGKPLPFPLEVEGNRVEGQGVTYYQFIIPIDRSGSSTQPADYDEEEATPEKAPSVSGK